MSAIEIPYTDTPRPDTGLTNAKLGIWLFLASEIMLFGGLFSAYILLRVGADVWPEGRDILNVPLATLNTFVLITSSITMVLAWASLVRGQTNKYRLYNYGTLLCGLIFLIIKYIEYSSKFHHGLFPSESTFMAIYFALTGLHGLHVVGGMGALAYLQFIGSKMWDSQPARFTGRVECAGLFWHLVDLVWIFLFPVLYLM
ncbi:MAG: Cytochrome c oxidase polypeptide I+III [Candidatus Moanabacter tarae]|uniref:Cytochrome bo(3) ubiquinol oxidase subunit 3 n=1 Tax=Candidatus Moanibacter tarae TaxID=2200854 RepID=A0A2Z4ANQ7_9BACT|nr:MAG: Cytochrome c oxidase polypeptide I+III [Candidatus Moanabacter tarae]